MEDWRWMDRGVRVREVDSRRVVFWRWKIRGLERGEEEGREVEEEEFEEVRLARRVADIPLLISPQTLPHSPPCFKCSPSSPWRTARSCRVLPSVKVEVFQLVRREVRLEARSFREEAAVRAGLERGTGWRARRRDWRAGKVSVGTEDLDWKAREEATDSSQMVVREREEEGVVRRPAERAELKKAGGGKEGVLGGRLGGCGAGGR